MMELRYSDDGDAYVDFPVTDRQGGTLSWTSPEAMARPVDGEWVTVPCAWRGTAVTNADTSTTRYIRVSLDSVNTRGRHELRLVVPGDNDIPLEPVNLI